MTEPAPSLPTEHDVLPLDLPIVPLADPSPSQLLDAHARVVPPARSSRLLDELERWCHDEPDLFSAFLVIGGQGSGKTRLGIELCTRLHRRDWLAGFLRHDLGHSSDQALVDLPLPRLIVVDHAETRVGDLEALVPALEAEQADKVRLLLLARPGIDAVDHPLPSHSDQLASSIDRMAFATLDAAMPVDERHELFRGATGELGCWLGVEHRPDPPAELASNAYADPLPVLIAVVLSLHGVDEHPTTTPELIEALLRYEDGHWLAARDEIPRSPGPPPPGLAPPLAHTRRRVVALATLAGALDESMAIELLGLLPELSALDDLWLRRRCARWVRSLYPGERWWNPIRPEAVAEHLVASSFLDLPEVVRGVLDKQLRWCGTGGQAVDHHLVLLTGTVDLLARATRINPEFAAVLAPVVTGGLGRLSELVLQQLHAQSRPAAGRAGRRRALALTGAVGRLVASVDPEIPPDALKTLARADELLPDVRAALDHTALRLRIAQVNREAGRAGDDARAQARLARARTELAEHLHRCHRTGAALNVIDDATDGWLALVDSPASPHVLELIRSVDVNRQLQEARLMQLADLRAEILDWYMDGPAAPA